MEEPDLAENYIPAPRRQEQLPDWTAGLIDEQSDDAAALLDALGLSWRPPSATAAVRSSPWPWPSAIPSSVLVAILNEPPMMAEPPDHDGTQAVMGRVFEEGVRASGSRQAVEWFVRFAAGDEVFEALEPGTRAHAGQRPRPVGTELGLERYHPDDATLAGIAVPVDVLPGRESAPLFRDAAAWLAELVGSGVQEIPGAHCHSATTPPRPTAPAGWVPRRSA